MPPLIITFTPRPAELNSVLRRIARRTLWRYRFVGLFLAVVSVPALLADDPAPSSTLGRLTSTLPTPLVGLMEPSSSGCYFFIFGLALIGLSFTSVRRTRRSLPGTVTGEGTYEFGPDHVRYTMEVMDQQVSWRHYRRAVRVRRGWLLVSEPGTFPVILPDRAFSTQQQQQFTLLLRDRGLIGEQGVRSSPDEPSARPPVEPVGA